ncbi:penicillin-binding transpeptidase domain-containing protein [Peribacillus glennii]|uniref:serine-type D-Ala-D-Ala carboxypeptidase n=1 Tax=Peribacillus glennii TaxID=2303991 RepID=A0A372L6Q7_9BACI|nr:penicillin-binding transpeptidase domain-containing protein [Peribacillus glennii]RFU60782.1 penicillin-binding transpeptidase domain-containing protein [Peribacillus glennii]
MKKLLLLFSILLAGLLVLAGCQNDPVPEDRLAAYTKLWNERKFDQMYGYLSADVKKKLSKKEFTERYEKIYKDIEAENLKVTYKKPKEPEDHDDKENVALPFSVKMDTMAGPVSFDQKATMVKEERDDQTNWYIKWNPGHIFAGMQENDKIGITTEPAIRGEIVDRNERGLAMNGIVAEVSLVPEQMAGKEASIVSQLGSLLNMSSDEINKLLNQPWVQPNMSVPIKKVDPAQTSLIQKLQSIPGVAINEVEERVYPYKEVTAHLVGYIGPVSAEDLKRLKGKGYSSNDEIGKRGLEQILEERLKGQGGAKIFIKGENGQDTVVAETPAKEGETITLTIDAELQKEIFNQYKKDTGSAAAIHPLTGETLALVSSPSFDPNKFVYGISSEEREALEKDPRKPLLNRFSSVYAPGSAMKPLTAAISLENGIDPQKTLNISGKQWSKKGWKDHSITRVSDPGKPIDMQGALIYSDNIYFAQRALELGNKKFPNGLKAFGYEDEMPFDYPIKPSKIGKLDSEGRLADSGYGQGQTLMSTIHAAASYTAFLNDGDVLAPSLISDDKTETKVWKENAMSADHAKQVTTMLKKVISDPKGTPHSASKLGIPLAGKTGTAELKSAKGQNGKENGWFVTYNTKDPRLLMAWMMEDVKGKGGSKYVVEKMKPVLKDYLK